MYTLLSECNFDLSPIPHCYPGVYLQSPHICLPPAGLPQPKTSESKDGKKEAIVMEDELEDIVKAKPTELAMQERPPVKKKTRQPVKIMIPALQV